jgi:putative hemolysin
MNKILKNIIFFLFLSGISNIVLGCEEKKKLGLPNPASQYCIEKGGKLEMRKDAKGGIHGICIFPGNLQCEEWAMFRGECPLGGIDVKGFSTPGAVTCAVKGGKVLENETKCQLPSGKICQTEDLYQGTCY